MAITANTGSNNWNTNGAWVGGVQPGAGDDVIIPATAVVTIPTATTVLGRSLTVQASGTVAWASTTAVLTLGDGTAGLGNVAISISATATITLTGIGTINLVSTSATQQTIATGGKTLPNITMNGAGSSYLQSDGLTSTGSFTWSAGTWDTGNQTNNTNTLQSSTAGTKTLTLGSTVWTTVSTNTPISMIGTNQTLTSSGGTSEIICNATANAPNWGGLTWNKVTMNGAGNTLVNNSGGLTCATFTRTGTAAKTDLMRLTGDLTVSGTLTINGNSTTNRMFVQSTVNGTQHTITAATVTVTNADFSDVIGAGAGSWNLASITGNSGDALGNSGITFTTPATQTFDNTNGNASTAARWTSRVPLPQDNIIINASSGNVTFDMPRVGANVTCTGHTGSLNLSSGGTIIYGSLTLATGQTISQTNGLTLSGRSSLTITSAGKSINSTIIDAPGGTYTMQDALTVALSVGSLTVTTGTFDTGTNFTLTCVTFSSAATTTRAINLHSSTVSITSTASATVWNLATVTGLTFSGGSSTITITNTSTNTRTFQCGGLTYGTLTYTVAGSTGTLLLGGASYFDTINFSDATNARTLQLPNGVLTTVKNFNVQGTSGKLMTVASNSGGAAAYIELVGAPVSMDYQTVTDIFSTLPYKYYAGANSTTSGVTANVTASAVVAGPSLYKQAENSSSTNSLTATFPFSQSATVSNLLVAIYTASANPGTVTTPAGYTLIDSSIQGTTAYNYTFYKVAAGAETAVTVASGNSVAGVVKLYEAGGFTGTPTLDVKDKNATAGAASLSTGSGVSNTANPAIAIAAWGAAASMGATVSFSNSFQEQRGVTQQTTARWAALLLTSNASQTTTNTWTTSRAAASQLVIFKDVSANTHLLASTGAGA